MYKYHSISVALACIFLVACSGSGSSPNTTNNSIDPSSSNIEILQGRFVDSIVEGLAYETDTLSGITDAHGTFTYEQGQVVQFLIGDIFLGEATPGSIITPVELVLNATNITDPTALNIARFLQTLDSDGNPENGIVISEFVRQQAMNKSIDFSLSIALFETDPDIVALIALLTAEHDGGPFALISADAAYTHILNSMAAEIGSDDARINVDPVLFNVAIPPVIDASCVLPPAQTTLPINYDQGVIKVAFKTEVTYNEAVDLVNAQNLVTNTFATVVWQYHYNLAMNEGVAADYIPLLMASNLVDKITERSIISSTEEIPVLLVDFKLDTSLDAAKELIAYFTGLEVHNILFSARTLKVNVPAGTELQWINTFLQECQVYIATTVYSPASPTPGGGVIDVCNTMVCD